MKLQILQDSSGKNTGVFVPMEDWTLIKTTYPDIETIDQDLSLWEKDLIDRRLESIARNPEKLKPVDELFEELDKQD